MFALMGDALTRIRAIIAFAIGVLSQVKIGRCALIQDKETVSPPFSEEFAGGSYL